MFDDSTVKQNEIMTITRKTQLHDNDIPWKEGNVASCHDFAHFIAFTLAYHTQHAYITCYNSLEIVIDVLIGLPKVIYI